VILPLVGYISFFFTTIDIMTHWKNILQQSVTTLADLKQHLHCDNDALDEVIANFPMRINPYYLSLIKKCQDPLWRQAVPDAMELQDSVCVEDPLGEENLSPVANLVHKYPDRALLLVTNECAMYCRFCTRKRKVGTNRMEITEDTLKAGFDYLRKTPQIREVLISGGDPLMLDDEKIAEILSNLKNIPSIEVIRIGTRIPCTLPMRITPQLVNTLKKFHPLYINTHFNHPDEITPQVFEACTLLANAGIPLGNHTVLLRGVNDNAETMRKLVLALLRMRVKPYYLFQADLARGTNHFRTPTKTGIEIMHSLIGHVSGMAIPTYAIDAPGGKGKIPLTPEYIVSDGDEIIFKNYLGELCSYPEV
jgi:lysine 2,3-aminomutase